MKLLTSYAFLILPMRATHPILLLLVTLIGRIFAYHHRHEVKPQDGSFRFQCSGPQSVFWNGDRIQNLFAFHSMNMLDEIITVSIKFFFQGTHFELLKNSLISSAVEKDTW
jgi:hypothetical protein